MRSRHRKIIVLVVSIVILESLLIIVKVLQDTSLICPKQNGMKRYLIYTCRLTFCGGFSDHLRGIFTVYILSKQTGRIFGIEQTSRCTPVTFLRPNRYNWVINQSEFLGLNSRFFSTTKRFKEKTDSTTNRKRNDFVHHLNESVVYLQTNTLADINQYADDFKTVFRELFVVESDIENDLRIFREEFVKKNKTVCAHIRTGKQPGFEDPYYNNLGNITAIWDFLSLYDRHGHVIFVASDSYDIKLSAKRRFPKRIVDIPGRTIFTAEASDDVVCSGHKKVLLDILFLSRCDVLLMTHSGMGLTASSLRGRKEDQYCFENHRTGVYPCPRYNLRWKRSREESLPLQGV